jgi:hypothetical protein
MAPIALSFQTVIVEVCAKTPNTYIEYAIANIFFILIKPDRCGAGPVRLRAQTCFVFATTCEYKPQKNYSF